MTAWISSSKGELTFSHQLTSTERFPPYYDDGLVTNEPSRSFESNRGSVVHTTKLPSVQIAAANVVSVTTPNDYESINTLAFPP